MTSATQTSNDGASLSRGLGWFSIALGVTELVAPRTITRAMGLRPDSRSSWILRAMGIRELAAGLAILFRPQRPLPVWARVAGDAMDLAALGTGGVTRRAHTARLVSALATVAGATALDLLAGRRVQRAYDAAIRPVIFAVTINRPPEEVFDFYRRFERLPQFMDYLESVVETGPKMSHWVAKLPVGGTVEWDAEITDERRGELITWESKEGAPVNLRGRVTFQKAPARNMTEVRVELELGVASTRPTVALAKYFTKSQIKGDLRRLKQVLETGEVLVSDASAHLLPHPAQPDDSAPLPHELFVPTAPLAQKEAVR